MNDHAVTVYHGDWLIFPLIVSIKWDNDDLISFKHNVWLNILIPLDTKISNIKAPIASQHHFIQQETRLTLMIWGWDACKWIKRKEMENQNQSLKIRQIYVILQLLLILCPLTMQKSTGSCFINLWLWDYDL